MPSTDHSQAVLQSEGMGTGSSRADRLTSFEPSDFSRPTGQEEEWRFTPMARIEPFLQSGLTGAQADVSAGKEWERVSRDDSRLGRVGKPEDLSSALAWQAFEKANVLVIPEGESRESVITLHSPQGMHAEHVYIRAEKGSQATVILDHTGEGDLTEGVEIDVAEDAHVTFVSVQEAGENARHFSNQRIRLGAHAKIRHIVVTLGANLVRLCTSLEYAGEGGDAELLGAYITDSGEHHEHRVFVDHEPAHCVSRVTYKGALQGEEAHSVWIGDVLIGAGATGTDSYELNRNLVLTKGAKADSVPNLEIETGEIEGAGHASATGRFDEEQLFYLRARGIPEDIARRLVVRGFFAELVEQIGVSSIQNKLMDAIESELNLGELPSMYEEAEEE